MDYSKLSCFTSRPNPQVRFLVNRNLDKLITLVFFYSLFAQSIKQIFEFTNTSPTKVKAISQLKYTLLLGQEGITPHTQTLVKSMVRMAQLDLQQIEAKVTELVSIIGFHVKSSYYIPLMMDILGQEEFKNSTKNTIVLLNMISHMFLTSQGLDNHIQQVTKVLAHYETIFYDNDQGLQAIFSIAKVLVNRIDKFQHNHIVSVLFSIVLNVQATKTIPQPLRLNAAQTMQLLAIKSGFKSTPQLHADQVHPILQKIISTKSYANWTKTSKDRFKFDTIVRNCHTQVIKFLPDILRILQYMINPQSDLEVRMDTLVLVQFMLTLEPIKLDLKLVAGQLMQKILIVAIQWKVGKPQIKIRKAGIINMILMIQNQIIDQDQLLQSYKDLIPHLKNCLNDDWAPELRLASCQFLEKYLNATKYKSILYQRQKIDTQQLRELYPFLLERLDDSQDPIRKKITTAINVFFSCQYIKLSESTFQYMVGAIFIHFDDNSEEIQDCIYLSLRFAAKIDPGQVLKAAEQNLKKMKHKEKCEQLIEFCKEVIEDTKI